MKKLLLILPLVFLLCLTFGCQKAEEVAEEPVVDVEADIAAIRGMLDQFDALVNAGEPERLVSLNYAENAVRMPPDEPIVKGRAAILEWFKQEAEQYILKIDNVPEEVQVDGDLAFMRGIFSGTITSKAGGEPIPTLGKWMSISKRQADGSWKVVADIFNRDNPPLTPLKEKKAADITEFPKKTFGDMADVEAISGWYERYVANNNAGDFASYGTFFTEDIIWLPPDAPVVIGKEAILDYARPFFELYSIHQEITVEEITVSGKIAFGRSSNSEEYSPKGEGESIKTDTKAIFIFQHQDDGTWICSRAIWNSNVPPAPQQKEE